MPLLALFDVDGTLFLTHDPLLGRALRETLVQSYGVELPEDAIERVDHRGQTVLRIARELLHWAGAAADDESLAGWCARLAQRYLELLAAADTSSWRAAPGAARALSRLEDGGVRTALLTGNPEPVARARMSRLGLARFFAPEEGGFGCEGEDRGTLLELARERAGGWPAAETVEIGDTLRDVESAHASGIRSIALRSPRTTESFAAADAVCDDLDTVAETLLAWSG